MAKVPGFRYPNEDDAKNPEALSGVLRNIYEHIEYLRGQRGMIIVGEGGEGGPLTVTAPDGPAAPPEPTQPVWRPKFPAVNPRKLVDDGGLLPIDLFNPPDELVPVGNIPTTNPVINPGSGTTTSIEGLPGEAADPQKARVQEADTLPDINFRKDGELWAVDDVIYRADRSPITSQQWKALAATGVIVTHSGTLANRPAASGYASGTLLWDTNRKILWRSDGTNWIYMLGVHSDSLGNIPTANLTDNDAGYRYHVTTYNHILEWINSASGWRFATGDYQGGYIQGFAIAPASGTGWQIADGSVNPVAVMTLSGTPSIPGTTNVTLPDQRNYYLKFGAAYDTTPNAAIAPTVTLSGNTDTAISAAASVVAQSGGANNISTITEGADTTFNMAQGHGLEAGDLITITGVTIAGGAPGDPNGLQTVKSVAGNSFTIEHDSSGGTYNDGVGGVLVHVSAGTHVHALSTGTATAGTNGEPPHTVWVPYIRL